MTSKKSYYKFLLLALKNHLWSIALTCIGLFFAMPVYSALEASIIRNNFIMGRYKEEYLTRIFARDVFGENNILLSIAVVILALVIAFNGFSYLFSKEKIDLYHSLPLKRKDLFFVTFLAGIITFVIPYLAFLIITLLLAQALGMLSMAGFIAALIMLGINLLGFLGIYSIAVLAIMLTGNLVVAILASGVLAFYIPLIKLLIMGLKEMFFVTVPSIQDNHLFRGSPIIAYFGLTEGMNTFLSRFTVSASNIIFYLIYIIVITLINYFLYSIRASETAGKSISFKQTMPVISVLLLVPMSIFGAIAFTGIASDGKLSYPWLIFGGIFTLFIGHLIVQAIFYRDFKSLFKNLINPLVSGAFAILILLVFIFDFTGYDRYFPNDSKFESIAVASYGLQCDQEYYDFDVEENEYGDKYYWIDQNTYRFDHVKITDIEFAKEFCQTALEDSRYFKEALKEDSFSYEGKAVTSITVMFKLKDGKSVYRDYTIDIRNHMDLYDKLYSNEEYKKGVFSIFEAEEKDIDNIRIADAVGDVGANLSKEQMVNLVNTYKEELLKQGGYELVDATPLAYFYKDYSFKENGYVNRYTLYRSYIYPSFTKTLSLLDEYGVDIKKYANVDNVDYIEITNYHYNDDSDDIELYSEKQVASDSYIYEENTDSKKYTDKEEIDKIFSVAVPAAFVDANSLLRDMAAIDVQVQFEEIPGNYNYYTISYYIPKGMVPDFVAEDVNYAE